MNVITLVKTVADQAARQRATLGRAHDAAADFHAAISRAMLMQEEIEVGKREGELDPYWETQFALELGNAAVALQKMPPAWRAILEVEIEAITQAGV